MSRAFVKEDDGDNEPKRFFGLPAPDDPAYNAAAALTLLEAARDGHTAAAESATGYRWGAPELHEHVRRLLEKEQARAEHEQDTRFIRMAERFLNAD